MSSPDSISSESSGPRARRRPRWRKWLIRFAIAFFVLLVVAELIARYRFGLGDPPLFIAHQTIEYLHKPSSSYQRFGNTISFNAHSMRSEEFPPQKSSANELRIIVMGDSIINGGTWTDQANIATETLKRNLQERFPARKVIVGNISATSWGPPNLLAYAQTYGLFDADAVIVVVGSEDYADAPTYKPLTYERPTRKPLLAIQDALVRYTPIAINYLREGDVPPPAYQPAAEEVDASLQALRELFDLVQAEGIPLAALFHVERDELVRDAPKPGYFPLRQAMSKRNVPIIDIGMEFATAINQNREPYRDWVHPNEEGQSIIAHAMEKWLLENLSR